MPKPGKLPGDLRTVFLDRDGVLNEKMREGRYVTSLDEFHVLPGVPEAIARLNRAGLRVVVVSNQRGIALGLYTATVVHNIHDAFQQQLAMHGARIDAFFICPHRPHSCNCRKPLPGLFEQAVNCFPDITAESSVMIGDSLVDMQFGRNLGMATVLIEGDPERQKPGNSSDAADLADLQFGSLGEAVDAILASLDEENQEPLLPSGIQIKKISEGVYSAAVFNLPPNLPWVKPEWATSGPMTRDDLIRELVAQGFHQIDIGDAFYEADRGWLNKRN